MHVNAVAKVKGNGIDAADFVAKTVFKAANGEANKSKFSTTANVPTHRADTSTGKTPATAVVPKLNAKHACKCKFTEPGSVGDDSGENRTKLAT